MLREDVLGMANVNVTSVDLSVSFARSAQTASSEKTVPFQLARGIRPVAVTEDVMETATVSVEKAGSDHTVTPALRECSARIAINLARMSSSALDTAPVERMGAVLHVCAMTDSVVIRVLRVLILMDSQIVQRLAPRSSHATCPAAACQKAFVSVFQNSIAAGF